MCLWVGSCSLLLKEKINVTWTKIRYSQTTAETNQTGQKILLMGTQRHIKTVLLKTVKMGPSTHMNDLSLVLKYLLFFNKK
jgi:hypothetical protein